MPNISETMICVARVVGAHGIKGQVKLKVFTENVDSLLHYGGLLGSNDQTYRLLHLKAISSQQALARLETIKTRNDAEGLRGISFYVSRDKLPTLNNEEFYHTDLIGMQVETTLGSAVGTIKSVLNFGAGDLLEVTLLQNKTLLVPFTRAMVPTIDMQKKMVSVDDAFLQSMLVEE